MKTDISETMRAVKDLTSVLSCHCFNFLWQEIVANFSAYRNVFAVVGVMYVSNKTLQILYSAIRGVATHGISRYLPVCLTKSGEWAVVTGPTEGIGRAFAVELARRGMSVLLLGRNSDKLNELSDFIRREYKQQTKIIIIDFYNPGNAYDDISDLFSTLDIGVVVNNVGTINDHPSFLHEMEDKDIMKMLTVNIQSVTVMTKLAVSHMREKRKGFIINVSSIVSLAPAPLLQVYAATKAYITSFSLAVQAEVKHEGITVQTLIPSSVKTKMIGYSPYLSTSMLVPTPEIYVQNALATLKYSSFTTGYWLHGIQAFVMSSLPLTSYVFQRVNLRFRRDYLSQRDS